MPTNLYGPNDNYHPTNSHVIPSLIRRIQDAKNKNIKTVACWGTGTPMREFLYVEDLAEACLFVLENWSPPFYKINHEYTNKELCWLNVGSNDEVSIEDLVNIISETIDYKGEITWDSSKPDGTPRKKLDSSRLRNLGWESKTNLRLGIKQTIESYKKERLLKINRA